MPPGMMEQTEDPEVTLKNGMTATSAGNHAGTTTAGSTPSMLAAHSKKRPRRSARACGRGRGTRRDFPRPRAETTALAPKRPEADYCITYQISTCITRACVTVIFARERKNNAR